MYETLCTEFYDADKKFAPEDEINFYKSFFNKNDLVLEPMCGSGRLLIPLLQEGYHIHGVDNSSAMLSSCKDRATQQKLHPTLYMESIETMSLRDKYNVILIPLGSFQLLYPRESGFRVLKNLQKHLHVDGKLILDLYVPWDALYENNGEEVTEKEVVLSSGEVIKHKSHNKTNKFEQYIFCESVYTKISNDKVIATENERMYISWYYRYEMELILEKYGFQNITYQEKHFTNEDHMIFIAEAT